MVEAQFGEAAQGVGGRLVGFFGVEVEFEQAFRRKQRRGFELLDEAVDAAVAVEALAFVVAVGGGAGAGGVQRFAVEQRFAAVDEGDGGQRVLFEVAGGVRRGEVHRVRALV